MVHAWAQQACQGSRGQSSLESGRRHCDLLVRPTRLAEPDGDCDHARGLPLPPCPEQFHSLRRCRAHHALSFWPPRRSRDQRLGEPGVAGSSGWEGAGDHRRDCRLGPPCPCPPPLCPMDREMQGCWLCGVGGQFNVLAIYMVSVWACC